MQGIYSLIAGMDIVRRNVDLNAKNLSNQGREEYSRVQGSTDIVIIGDVTFPIAGPVIRTVDSLIERNIVRQLSFVEYSRVLEEVSSQIDDLNGRVGENSALTNSMDKFIGALSDLGNEPSSSIQKSATVNAARILTNHIRKTSNEIQELRQNSDEKIRTAIQAVNIHLEEVMKLNNAIVSDVSKISLSDLEDVRDRAIKEIAKRINIQVYKEKNVVRITTEKNHPLLDEIAYPLIYTSSGSINHSSDYKGESNNIEEIFSEDVEGNKLAVTSHLSGGEIGGLLKMRDDKKEGLLAAQSILDNLTKNMAKAINDIHNKGTSYRPLQQLEGGKFISSGQENSSISWKNDATVRIAILDKKGNFADTGEDQFYYDLNLNFNGAGGKSLQQIVLEINAQSDFPVTATLSNGSYGKLILKANNDNQYIAFGEIEGQTPPETTDNESFSSYFQMNDFFVTKQDQYGRGYANTISVREDILVNSERISMSTLNTIAIPKQVSDITATPSETMGISEGDNKVIVAIQEKLMAKNSSFDASGRIGAKTSSFEAYIKDVVGEFASLAQSNSQLLEAEEILLSGYEERRSIISGVNKDQEAADMLVNKMLFHAQASGVKFLVEMNNALLDLLLRI